MVIAISLKELFTHIFLVFLFSSFFTFSNQKKFLVLWKCEFEKTERGTCPSLCINQQSNQILKRLPLIIQCLVVYCQKVQMYNEHDFCEFQDQWINVLSRLWQITVQRQVHTYETASVQDLDCCRVICVTDGLSVQKFRIEIVNLSLHCYLLRLEHLIAVSAKLRPLKTSPLSKISKLARPVGLRGPPYHTIDKISIQLKFYPTSPEI